MAYAATLLPQKESQYTFITTIKRWMEAQRVFLRLTAVEYQLRLTLTARLSQQQRIKRANCLDLLREYRKKKLFPHNIHFPSRREPYFIDHRGVRCAMAYIIEQTGYTKFVHEVADSNNNVYVDDIQDRRFFLWLETYGVTQKEAARIQPTYGYRYPQEQNFFGQLAELLGLSGLVVSLFVLFLFQYLLFKLMQAGTSWSRKQKILLYAYASLWHLLLIFSFVLFVLSY